MVGILRILFRPVAPLLLPKQLQPRQEKRQALLVGSRRRCASCAAIWTVRYVETLLDTAQGESRPGKRSDEMECVGIAVDVNGGKFLLDAKEMTDAGQGRIFRAGLEILQGPDSRKP